MSTKYTIYRITIGDQHYIGSTKSFQQRKMSHKSDCNSGCKVRVYEAIREAGGWDKCEMIPIEQIECEDKITALMREEYWRRQYLNTLNVRQAYVSPDELNERIIISNAKTNAIYGPINNAKRCLDYIVCECGGEFQRHCKTAHLRGKRHTEFRIASEQATVPPVLLSLENV